MLKKELEEKYESANATSQRLLREEITKNSQIKKAAEEILQLKKAIDHHEKTQEQVVSLICSMSAILCPESVEHEALMRDAQHMSPIDRDMLPGRPESQLFDVLQEIKTRLMNGGLNNIHLL